MVSDLFSKEPVNFSDCRVTTAPPNKSRVSYRPYRITVYMSHLLFESPETSVIQTRQLINVCVSVVSNVSELLGLDSFQLSEVLTQRSMILRGEEICSPLTVEQVMTHQTGTGITHRTIPLPYFSDSL